MGREGGVCQKGGVGETTGHWDQWEKRGSERRGVAWSSGTSARTERTQNTGTHGAPGSWVCGSGLEEDQAGDDGLGAPPAIVSSGDGVEMTSSHRWDPRDSLSRLWSFLTCFPQGGRCSSSKSSQTPPLGTEEGAGKGPRQELGAATLGVSVLLLQSNLCPLCGQPRALRSTSYLPLWEPKCAWLLVAAASHPQLPSSPAQGKPPTPMLGQRRKEQGRPLLLAAPT